MPWLLVGLPAGVLVDRFDRRRLIRLANVARAVLLALAVLAIARDAIGIFALYGLAALLGAGETVQVGATTALLPSIVPAEELPRANGMLATSQMLGEQTFGPVLGGLLFGAASAVPFAADGLFFVGSALMLSPASGSRVSSPGSGTDAPPTAPLRRSARAALAWFLGQPALELMVATIAAMAFSQSMVLGVLVLFALRCLHIARAGYGVLLAVGAAGSVASGAGAKTVMRRLGPAGTVLVAGAVAGTAYLALSTVSSAALAGISLFAEGAAVMTGNVASNVVRQSLIPGDMLGRVGNVTRMFIWGAVPLGALAGGAVASAWGLRVPLVLAGGLQLLTVAVAARPLRRLLGSRLATEAQKQER